MVSTLNPRTTEFEFGGLIGALAISVGLPVFSIILNQMVRPDYFIKGFFQNFDLIELWNGIKPLRYYLGNRELWTVYGMWYGILAVLDVILPGRAHERCAVKRWFEAFVQNQRVAMIYNFDPGLGCEMEVNRRSVAGITISV